VIPHPLSIAHALTTYAAGLDAEMALLRQLEQVAARLREATASGDIDRLNHCTDERATLMRSLVSLEHELQPVRARLAMHHDAAALLSGFHAVAARHREAASLIAAILSADKQSLDSLREAEQARRFAAQAIEAGETTLAAYRRVVAPRPTSAAIVDERG
jgi:hypothetical protein